MILDRWERSGSVIPPGTTATVPSSPEAVRDVWPQVCDFTRDPWHPSAQGEYMGLLMSGLNNSTTNTSPPVEDPLPGGSRSKIVSVCSCQLRHI